MSRRWRRVESSGAAAMASGDEVVDQDGAEQEEDEELVPGGVEDDRHEGQPGDDRAPAVAAEQMEAQHGDRQEDEEKSEGVEEHKEQCASQLLVVSKGEDRQGLGLPN